MTTDEVLFIVLILIASAGVGLLALIAKDLHAYFSAHGAAPSALHVVALTEAVEAHVAVGKVQNEQTHGIVSRIEKALSRPHAAPAASVAAPAPDPHPAGMVATPAIPVVMPSTAQPVAPVDMAAMLAHMQAMAEHMKTLAQPAPVVVQTTITQPAPEPTATPLVIADPTPGVVSPSVGAAA